MRGPITDELPACRSIRSVALPEVAAYGWSRHLTGWFVVTAEGDDCYINPVDGRSEWDRTQVGIFIPETKSRVLRFDGNELGYYTAAGRVRLEEIVWVDKEGHEL
jgi:hypothetical protein